MKEVTIYTDGACSGNPGPGGWAAVLIYGEHHKEISGGARNTTNNRMELTAAIQSLSRLKTSCRVKLYTDSAYLVNCMKQGWYVKWEKNGWVNSKKDPVENRDLWQELLKEMRRHEVEFIKVKGHSDNELNNRCDELARGAIPK
ncbi:ribonuclease HI [Paludifilum halophilum]|uniref:Ribonuclease H n=1 Tax=Paludifilum halophilum TaxID=1642702 RepID=A0A235B892_9BACL|nr:ribonuclease HI [Paludifilum halophilum]OYD08506.1 ribonuclease HI [Paludifilum halophilum]